MKSIFITSYLLSAALAAPFITRAVDSVSTATIQLKTGDGDTSVQFTVTLDAAFSTAGRADLIPGDCA
jgi:hypothetical protein